MRARSLVGRMPGLVSRARSPRPVRGPVDAGIRHAPPLPVCGFSGPDHGLQTATDLAEFDHALGVTVRGLDKGISTLLAVARPGLTVRSHTDPVTWGWSRDRSLLFSDYSRSRERS